MTERFARLRTLLRELLAADASRAGRQCSHCPLSHWRWADHNLRLARRRPRLRSRRGGETAVRSKRLITAALVVDPSRCEEYDCRGERSRRDHDADYSAALARPPLRTPRFRARIKVAVRSMITWKRFPQVVGTVPVFRSIVLLRIVAGAREEVIEQTR